MTIEDIKALKVATDEVLVLRVTRSFEDDYDWTADLRNLLIEVGLGDRSLIIVAEPEELELAVVKK